MWLLQGQSGVPLTLEVLDANIVPKSRDCGYDGVIIYEGNSVDGVRHGMIIANHIVSI